MASGRKPQPVVIRLTHWVNVPALTILAMSGLQILRAYPYWGPQGAQYDWMPLQNWDSPDWLRVGGWLAGARHWHFAVAWLFVVTGVVYVGYVFASGEWRRRFFWPPRDLKPAVQQALHYLRVRKRAPPVDLYNGLQRAGYTAAIALGLVELLTGLAIYKPVQFHDLAWCFGGYDGARVLHFLGLLALGGFIVGHVVMVALHPRSLVAMVTGGEPR